MRALFLLFAILTLSATANKNASDNASNNSTDVFKVDFGEGWSFPSIGVTYPDHAGLIQTQADLELLWKVLENSQPQKTPEGEPMTGAPQLDFKKHSAIWYTGGSHRPVDVNLLRVEKKNKFRIIIEEEVKYGQPQKLYLWLIAKVSIPVLFEIRDMDYSELKPDPSKVREYSPAGGFPSR